MNLQPSDCCVLGKTLKPRDKHLLRFLTCGSVGPMEMRR